MAGPKRKPAQGIGTASRGKPSAGSAKVGAAALQNRARNGTMSKGADFTRRPKASQAYLAKREARLRGRNK